MPGLPAGGGGLSAVAPSLAERLAGLDRAGIEAGLAAHGHATTPVLLEPGECDAVAALYDEDERFRSRVDMGRHRFGEGEYKYFAEPLPPLVAALREGLYPALAPIANRWAQALGGRERYPGTLAGLRALCARRGQRRPTPLLLRYAAGGHNRLHQDLYGAIAFPLQATILLSRPRVDFTGGEFLLVEQYPRAQSRGEVVPLERGMAVIFPTRHRPVTGARGPVRVTVRHGVSRVRGGTRLTLGIIFHDAE